MIPLGKYFLWAAIGADAFVSICLLVYDQLWGLPDWVCVYSESRSVDLLPIALILVLVAGS